MHVQILPCWQVPFSGVDIDSRNFEGKTYQLLGPTLLMMKKRIFSDSHAFCSDQP